MSENEFTLERFGGIGDGKFDNLTAFQRALSAGVSRVTLRPGGHYYVSDSVQIDFSRYGRKKFRLEGQNSRIVRHTQDAAGVGHEIVNDTVLRFVNPHEYTLGIVGHELEEGICELQVNKAGVVGVGDTVLVYSQEVYGTGNDSYPKGFCALVVALSAPDKIILSLPLPFSFNNRLKPITLLGWKTQTVVSVDDVDFHWVTSDGAPEVHTVGISAIYTHFAKFSNIRVTGVTGAGFWIERSYHPTVEHSFVQSSANRTIAAYGIEYGGVTHGRISHCTFTTARHSVGFTAMPSVGCLVEDSVLNTAGEHSGYSFNAHVAHSVDVINCKLNDGAKFAGGTFKFRDCEISTRLNGAAGVFQRRGITKLGGLEVVRCKIHIRGNKPGFVSHPGLLYNPALSVTAGTIEHGDLIFRDNDIYSHTAGAGLLWFLNWQTAPTTCKNFIIDDNRFYGAFRAFFESTGTIPSSIIANPAELIITNNRFSSTGGDIISDTVPAGLFSRVEISNNTASEAQVVWRSPTAQDVTVKHNTFKRLIVRDNKKSVIVDNNRVSNMGLFDVSGNTATTQRNNFAT